MTQVLTVLLIIVSALLMTAILMQQRGVGLSATFGGGGEVYRAKRGPERFLANSTIVLAILFVSLSFIIPLLG